ncbi:MAG: hypothetical protein L3J52_08095 [Proteobacteria bacterium]|nr:hypothetical protein [Pseudomonadota bacterium]
MFILMRRLVATMLLAMSSMVLALQDGGPLILGGDDLDDHGSRNASGVNIDGWAYAESAVQGIISQVASSGSTIDIVAIGPMDPGAGNFPSGDSGAMVASVTANLGLTVLYLDGQVAIQQFFSDLSNNVVNPRVIWIVSDGSSNDLSFSDEAELALHGAALNTFQQMGGGILSHTHEYDWLISLIPGIQINDSCSIDITFTAAGNSAFPGITNAQVSSGPCHKTFTGTFGGLDVLATDSNGLVMIIGGSAGTTITPSAVQIPAVSTWSSIIFIGLIVMMYGFTCRSRKLFL